jgi:hypothetical protein
MMTPPPLLWFGMSAESGCGQTRSSDHHNKPVEENGGDSGANLRCKSSDPAMSELLLKKDFEGVSMQY